MCDQCGISWRKYGDIRSGRIDEPKKGNGIDKRENTPQPPVKRTKVCAGVSQVFDAGLTIACRYPYPVGPLRRPRLVNTCAVVVKRVAPLDELCSARSVEFRYMLVSLGPFQFGPINLFAIS
jgi:hypothetical protein